jgi:hypothetical protein
MAKLPECDRCRFYAHNPHLICTIFPNGPADDHCPHFCPDPEIEPEELWAPQGTKFIDGELVIDERSFYDGVEIIQPVNYLTPQEKLELLDTHPYFTGRCPQCKMPYSDDAAPVHWDCSYCGWVDDTI